MNKRKKPGKGRRRSRAPAGTRCSFILKVFGQEKGFDLEWRNIPLTVHTSGAGRVEAGEPGQSRGPGRKGWGRIRVRSWGGEQGQEGKEFVKPNLPWDLISYCRVGGVQEHPWVRLGWQDGC